MIPSSSLIPWLSLLRRGRAREHGYPPSVLAMILSVSCVHTCRLSLPLLKTSRKNHPLLQMFVLPHLTLPPHPSLPPLPLHLRNLLVCTLYVSTFLSPPLTLSLPPSLPSLPLLLLCLLSSPLLPPISFPHSVSISSSSSGRGPHISQPHAS